MNLWLVNTQNTILSRSVSAVLRRIIGFLPKPGKERRLTFTVLMTFPTQGTEFLYEQDSQRELS